jgi:hypothetical protein
MTVRDERDQQAHETLTRAGAAMAEGATMDPDFVMRSLAAFRHILRLHAPTDAGRGGLTCGMCSGTYPCTTTRHVLGVLGVEVEIDE